MNRAEKLGFITSIVLDVALILIISNVFDFGFWETYLWVSVIQIALWAIKVVREVIILLVVGTDNAAIKEMAQKMKDAGYPSPQDWHYTFGDYLSWIRADIDLSAEIRIDAAQSEANLFQIGRKLTIPAQFLNDKNMAKSYEVIKREFN